MAFTVEDGAGLSSANSYVSVEDADAYFADRGNTEWAAATQQSKEIALVKATDYIETRFGSRFKGTKKYSTQALSFPRAGESGVPQAVVKATCEYAVRALEIELAPDIVGDPRGLQVASVRERVDVIETHTTYAPGSVREFQAYPMADNLLKPLLRPAGVVRA